MTRFKIQMEIRPFASDCYKAWKRVCAYVSAFDEEHAMALAPRTDGYSVRNESVHALDGVE